MRNLTKARDLGRRSTLCVLDTTVILYMVFILLMTVNPSLRALPSITAHIGAAYSSAPIPHNILVPDWVLGFTLLIIWDGIVIVRGVILLDKLSRYVQTCKRRKSRYTSC